MLIVAIYYEGVNSINQTTTTPNAFGDTHDDFTQELVLRTVSILCKFRSNLVHIYYDKALKTNVAEELIRLLNNCASLMLVRWVYRKLIHKKL